MSVSAGREGGCQCAAIRYRLLRTPLALYACHCRACQKQSSSAFGMSLWTGREGVEFRGAAPRIYRTRGDSGLAKHCAFCSECGTRLYHETAGSGILSIKAGSLDDTSDLAPTSHLWVKRAQPWMAVLLQSACCFEAEPESGETLSAQWRDAAAAEGGR